MIEAEHNGIEEMWMDEVDIKAKELGDALIRDEAMKAAIANAGAEQKKALDGMFGHVDSISLLTDEELDAMIKEEL